MFTLNIPRKHHHVERAQRQEGSEEETSPDHEGKEGREEDQEGKQKRLISSDDAPVPGLMRAQRDASLLFRWASPLRAF